MGDTEAAARLAGGSRGWQTRVGLRAPLPQADRSVAPRGARSSTRRCVAGGDGPPPRGPAPRGRCLLRLTRCEPFGSGRRSPGSPGRTASRPTSSLSAAGAAPGIPSRGARLLRCACSPGRRRVCAAPPPSVPRPPLPGIPPGGPLASLRGSPGRNRTYVACPDSKSGGPCQQTNRGPPSGAAAASRVVEPTPPSPPAGPCGVPMPSGAPGTPAEAAQCHGERRTGGQEATSSRVPDDRPRAPRAAHRHRPQALRRQGLRGRDHRGDRGLGRGLQARRLRALRRQGGPLRRRRRPRDRGPAHGRHLRPGLRRHLAPAHRARRPGPARLRRGLHRRLPDPRARQPGRAGHRVLRQPDERHREPGRAHPRGPVQAATSSTPRPPRCTRRCSSG